MMKMKYIYMVSFYWLKFRYGGHGSIMNKIEFI